MIHAHLERPDLNLKFAPLATACANRSIPRLTVCGFKEGLQQIRRIEPGHIGHFFHFDALTDPAGASRSRNTRIRIPQLPHAHLQKYQRGMAGHALQFWMRENQPLQSLWLHSEPFPPPSQK